MTDQSIDTSREARYGVTRKKHITITLAGHERVARWAEEQGVTFSAAIETLALMGMGTDAAVTFPALTSGLLERIVQRQYNRFARLLSQTALAAGAANWKADYLMLQLIRQEAHRDPADFIQNMAVSSDPQDGIAAQIRRMRDEVATAAEAAALRQLKKPLQEVTLLLPEDGGEEVGHD
jgi:hypothetical protein